MVVDNRLILSSLGVFFPTGTKSHNCFGSLFHISSLTPTFAFSSVCSTKPEKYAKFELLLRPISSYAYGLRNLGGGGGHEFA